MFGARAVLKSVLNDFPGADIGVSVVWIQMPGFRDNETTAGEIARTLNDPRVRHFYDPKQTHLAGKAFAKGRIRGGGPAWDIYFFYGKGEVWGDDPPAPVDWMHQLGGGGRGDQAHFQTGDDLVKSLHEAMHSVTGAECISSD